MRMDGGTIAFELILIGEDIRAEEKNMNIKICVRDHESDSLLRANRHMARFLGAPFIQMRDGTASMHMQMYKYNIQNIHS